MSRSWERQVRKNTSAVTKYNKKRGAGSYVPKESRIDRFRGRNYILPIAILLFISFYTYLGTLPASASAEGEAVSGLFWVTIVCYIILAMLFFFRRPYLAVAHNYVQTRKMTGDKRIMADGIKRIQIFSGHIIIEQTKGANWMFSRALNRYPIPEMAERLREFAKDNQIDLVENG
ncbi:hypothetical protein [Paenibacillus sp. 1P07SE]|uniref:hypothetical protein n=1 Tax=Paenibacillus sp. 1P07SE TaxID=3132209 RepID=UPI0039A4EA8F